MQRKYTKKGRTAQKISDKMLNILIPTFIIVAVAVVLLSIGIIVRGRFVNTHVSGNRALRRQGIHCAQQQDREARQDRGGVKEREKLT